MKKISIFAKLKGLFNMKKEVNYHKESIRGTIKEMMRVRGLRAISLKNYYSWLDKENKTGVHSLKINLEDGFIHMYCGNGNGNRAGKRIESVNDDTYDKVFGAINDILKNEKEMPSKVKRNVMVKMSR